MAFLGLPEGPVTLLDADLSTITTAADRLMRVDGPAPYIAHNEFESGKDTAGVPGRLLQYNVNAEAKHGLPVLSMVCLLHKGADSPQITGEILRTGPDGVVYHVFRYRVIRLWQEDAERSLTGGLGLLPFAPIARTTEASLPKIIQRMEARIDAEIEDDNEAGDLWTATYVLMGLRYNKALNARLLQRVRRMKESVTYQAILEEGEAKGRAEGRIEGEYRALLHVGKRRLGKPSPDVVATLQAIRSVERLETLLDRVVEVESWEDLLRP